MSVPIALSRTQVLAYRAAAQGLHREQTQLADLAVLDLGVQDSGSHAARLAFDARLDTTPPTDGHGPGSALALVWSLRGAPHVHRRVDLDALAGALWPISEADAVLRLSSAASVRQAGISAMDAYEMTVTALRNVVIKPTDKGAASAGVTAVLPEALTRECRVCRTRHVFELPFRLGALPAGLELTPDTAPPVLRPRSKASTPTAVDVAALQAMITAYLSLLGPAGPAEVASYLEARRTDIVEHWPGGLSEVSIEGRQAWLPAECVDVAAGAAAPPELVRLLGGYDPYLQARDRDLLVPDKRVHKELWPVLGRPGVLLVGGEVAGTWRAKAAGRKLTLTVEPFAIVASSVWGLVEDEAQRVAAVRGAASVAVRRVE